MTDVTAAAPAKPVRELLPNLVWEAVLLLAAIGVTIALAATNSAVFGRGTPWGQVAVAGFAAMGLALSMRTGTPNLAVGNLAALAGWIYVDADSIVLALLAVLGLGLVMALVTGLTGLPAWAVTLPAGFGVSAILLGASDARTAPLRNADKTVEMLPWVFAFVVLSVGGAVLFAVPAVRRFLSANRPAGGEAGAFSAPKLLGALVGVLGSSVLAGVAGIVLVQQVRAATPFDSGLLTTAVVVVLLAGISPFGRRAGIFGVTLAVIVVSFTRIWMQLEAFEAWQQNLVLAILAFVGIIAVWLIELVGRRISPLVTPAAAAPPPAPFGAYGMPAPPPGPVFPGLPAGPAPPAGPPGAPASPAPQQPGWPPAG
jgi:ribose/xylose/arabinose/galactoside ABC-type transport system permease subunit